MGDEKTQAEAWDARGKRLGAIEEKVIEMIALCLMCETRGLPAIDKTYQRTGFKDWFAKYEANGGENMRNSTHLTNVLRKILECMTLHNVAPGDFNDALGDCKQHTAFTRRVVYMIARIRERALGMRWPDRNPAGWAIIQQILSRTVPLPGFDSMSNGCRHNGTMWPHQVQCEGSFAYDKKVNETLPFFRTHASSQLVPIEIRPQDIASSGKNTSLGFGALSRLCDHLCDTCFVYRDYERKRDMLETPLYCSEALRLGEEVYTSRDHWTTCLATSHSFLCATASCRTMRFNFNVLARAHRVIDMYNPRNFLHNQQLTFDFHNASVRSFKYKSTTYNSRNEEQRMSMDEIDCELAKRFQEEAKRDSFLCFADLHASRGDVPRIRDPCISDRKTLYKKAAESKEVAFDLLEDFEREEEEEEVEDGATPCSASKNASSVSTVSTQKRSHASSVSSGANVPAIALLEDEEDRQERKRLKMHEKEQKRKKLLSSKRAAKRKKKMQCEKKGMIAQAKSVCTYRQAFEFLGRNNYLMQEGHSMYD